MTMPMPPAFDVAGSLVADVHAVTAQQVLSGAKATGLRPLCLCQSPGVEMYIAAAGQDLIVKRMPGTAAPCLTAIFRTGHREAITPTPAPRRLTAIMNRRHEA